MFPTGSQYQCDAFCLLVSAAWFHPVSAQEQLSEDYIGLKNRRTDRKRDKILIKICLCISLIKQY